MNAEDRLAELRSKIDAFFSRVAGRYPGALACAPGCDDCCRRELTVTSIEAAGIERAVRALDPTARAELARRAAEGAPCVALSGDGRCAVYEVRPVVCRSHGLPIRFEETDASGKRSLPVIDACPKNFTEHDLRALDASCLLDQRTLSAMLGAIDALRADEVGAPRGARRSLREVIAAAAA